MWLPPVHSVTCLNFLQRALENFFWPPKALTRFLMGPGRAFLRDGHRHATLTSDCGCEGRRKVLYFQAQVSLAGL